DDPPRRAAAGDRHHRPRHPDEGSGARVLRCRRLAVPGALGHHRRHRLRRGVRRAEPAHPGRVHRRGRRAAALPRRHADRALHAGDGAEPGGGAPARHPRRAHGPLHLPHQCGAGLDRGAAGHADLPGQVHQRRAARPVCVHRRADRRLQPGARRDPRRGAARRDRQLLRRVHLVELPHGDPAAGPDRGHPGAAAGPARPGRGAHGMSRRGLLFGGLLALAGVFLLVAPLGLKPYGIFILSMWAVMTIAAIGLNLTLGYAGQISLAQAAFVGIGAYITALLTTKGWPFWSTYLLGGMSCFAIGLLLGYPALRVQHHYLAFVTLAFHTLVYLIFRNEEWLTGGIYGISNVPRPDVAGWSMNGPRQFYYFCLAHLALVSLATWWLIRSPWGRAFVALRENPVRALSLGVDTRRYTLMAFALGAGLGGISGALYAPLVQFVDPTPFALGLSLNLLLMVVVGGSGFFFAPFLGAMVA